ncbi:sugar ABC transporter substrate-binding protein [Phototrophicus methaneseepsis]|uniref:Sugar ABC transporter substrate-binding protein n=1 Tax=Phototrophicus methaneseepsis TaxID=2710758 RepID=A0A7S8IFP6_9CHLR|nr:sugar ABC transporter substrate-binding protein [Phototrophicus methaneseepsis]QPC84945.1 sugar ABC transporter substrate-binding protein [Phototrophicus methaneseepsis]
MRRFAPLFLVSLLIALISGSALAQEETTVTWAFWGSPEELATHEQVAAAFMEEYPDINIEIWHAPWSDYFTNIQTLWASGDSSQIPDVAFLTPITTYASDGVLEPLDPFIEETGFDREDFWPGLLEYAMYDGTVYGFPRDISTEVLYYNKDIFDEVGLEYPNEDWTWDDLLAAAEQLTIAAPNGRVSRYALGMEGGKYQLWVAQNNGGILDDMVNPTRCTLTEPESVEAVQFFADMMANNYAMPDANLSQAGGDSAVFQSGQAAMIIQNASRVPAFNSAGLNYDIAVVPIPEDGHRAASAAGAAWTMSAFSDNKDAAWTFLSWLQSTEGGQAIYTQSGEIVPALRSTANSDVFLGSEEPPVNRQAFITESESAQVGRIGLFPEWNELNSTIISPGMQTIWSGEASVEDALASICESTDAFLAEHGYGAETE